MEWTGGTHSFDQTVDAARRRDADALSALFRAHHVPMLRYLRAVEPKVADDLAGEVWVAVAQHIGSFTGDERDFRAWLFSIARRRLADHRRRAIRRATAPAPPEDFAGRPTGPDPADTATERLSGQDAIDRLARSLPADQAEIVLLRVVGGLSVEEVARLTGKSPGAVRVAQHRALKRLAVAYPPRVPHLTATRALP